MFPFARSSQGVAVAAGEFTPGGGWYSSSAGRRWCCGNIVMVCKFLMYANCTRKLDRLILKKNNLWQKSNRWRHHLMIVRKDRNHEHGSCYCFGCFGRFCFPFSPFPRRVAQVGRVLAGRQLLVGWTNLFVC